MNQLSNVMIVAGCLCAIGLGVVLLQQDSLSPDQLKVYQTKTDPTPPLIPPTSLKGHRVANTPVDSSAIWGSRSAWEKPTVSAKKSE